MRTATLALLVLACSPDPSGPSSLLAGDAAPITTPTPGRAPNEPGDGADAGAGVVSCSNVAAWSAASMATYSAGSAVTYAGHLWSCSTAWQCVAPGAPGNNPGWTDLGPCPAAAGDGGAAHVDAQPSSSSPDAGAGDARPAKLVDCGTTSEWAPATAYSLHEQSRHLGRLFECSPGDPPLHHQCAAATYEPGKPGGPWAQAWTELGTCR